MTAYITLVIITAILSIAVTIKYITIDVFFSPQFFQSWIFGVIIGLALLVYVTLPLMEWSLILNYMFWTATIIQLVAVILALLPTSHEKTILEK